MMTIQQLRLKMTADTVGVCFAVIFPQRRIAGIIGISIALAGVLYLFKSTLPLCKLIGTLAESLLLGIIWSAVYLFILRTGLLDRWHKFDQTGDSTES